MNKQILFLASLMLPVVFLFIRCNEDDEFREKAGTLVIKITDTASDDEDIQGVYITVAELKVNGKPIRNFSPQTLKLSELRNGKSEMLINKELAAKEYQQISLVLTSKNNNSDTAPGCYVLTKDDSTHDLFADSSVSTNIEIPVSKNFELFPGEETNLIIDIDMRKAIVRSTSGKSSYSFVTQPELENAVRLVNEKKCGTITGKVKAKNLENNKIYVFVYRKEKFSASVEGTGQGKSNILFANAVTSTVVEPDGSYTIPFIEEGLYDIRLASFKRNKDNLFYFDGYVRTTSKRTGILLSYVSVSAGSETEINIEVFSLY